MSDIQQKSITRFSVAASEHMAVVERPYTGPYGEDSHGQEWMGKIYAIESMKILAAEMTGREEAGAACTPALANRVLGYAAREAELASRGASGANAGSPSRASPEAKRLMSESSQARGLVIRTMNMLGEIIGANPAIIDDPAFAANVMAFSAKFPDYVTPGFAERSEAAANRPIPERVRSVFGPRANGGKPQPA
ncbi:MAG: hypothetical protein WDO70_11070 [Alphaproteobacteria bacterium]